jgi:hypothetical protein
MKAATFARGLLLVLSGVVFGLVPRAGVGVNEQATEKPRAPWTLDEATSQLHLAPKDPFLQYVALQLARREGRFDQVAQEIEGLVGREDRQFGGERASRVDVFSIFTGALAVQESLQLDTLRGERRTPQRPVAVPVPNKIETSQQARTPAEKEWQDVEEKRLTAEEKRRKELVPVSFLSGPTIKSHPWEQMLAGKKPEISPLSLCVPDDFYFVEFRSLNKLLDLVDQAHSWSNYFFNQASQEARTQLVGERLKKQLAVETNPLLRPFYDLGVEEVGLTGSDLFANEGSDVTVLFKIKQAGLFKARMDGFLTSAQKARPDAKRTDGQYLGVNYVHLATPDRGVHVFSAYPRSDLHVRSNSLPAFKRILESISGKSATGQAVRRLGETNEFAYIRTLLPRGAKEEDGLVYLSDPFIRRLVGPEVKLTERRRILCYNHLRMIGHASLLYRAEHGRAPRSFAELADTQCAPGTFGEGPLCCPDGGKYSLSEDGMTGVCSHHGRAESLIPCCEIPVAQIKNEEADEYRAFLQDYNQYWRMYFDPIALRVQINPDRYRFETIVLPLIDNSIYTGLSHILGGKPEPLDALAVPKRNIFSVAARFNKRDLLRDGGLDEPEVAKGEPKDEITRQEMQCKNNLQQIGLALHNYHDAYGHFPPYANFDQNGKPLLSWRVHLLPFIDQEELYRAFHRDEPWDSEHNKKLIARMPAVYRCPNQKLKEPGRTTYLAPVGEKTMFSGGPKGMRLSDVTDGTTNTIFVVDADDQHAVTWTRPDDLKYDPQKPRAGLTGHHPGFITLLFADARVHFFRDTIDDNTLGAVFTANGGEIVQLPAEMQSPASPGQDLLGMAGLHDLPGLRTCLARGIGDQIGLHVYDGVQLFDLNLPAALGMAMSSFGGRARLGWNELPIVFIAASVNSPVYVAIPVKDPKIVDEFLGQLDSFLAGLARQPERQAFFGVDREFYRFTLGKDKDARAFAIRFGPVKWRLFWARIGNGLYVASKRFILDDLQAMENARPSDRGPEGHAMIRIRPKNWDQVLSDFRLGWAENNREACHNNLGPLASLTRALHGTLNGDTASAAEKYLGARFFCPDGGHYVVSPDGRKVTCSLHGDAMAPRQPLAPADNSPPNRILRDFRGMTVNLTFLEDGLHAVVTIDRK